MPRRTVPHTVRQSRPLRCIPRIPLPPEEQYIGLGRLPKEIHLNVDRDLHRRQRQLQESAQNLMRLKANKHRAKTCRNSCQSPYFGISRSALNTGKLPQLWSTIPHCAFSV